MNSFSDLTSTVVSILPTMKSTSLFLTTFGIILIGITAFIYLCKAVILLFRVYVQLQTNYQLIEITPPASSEKSAYTTDQLLTLVYGLGKILSWKDRVLGLKKSYSLEIVSSKEQGIRYIMRVPVNDVDIIHKNLLSYSPGIIVKNIQDYISDKDLDSSTISNFVLNRHFAYPLKRQEELKEHDPIAYITGNMTKLSDHEFMSLQLIISPTDKKSLKDIKRITNLIYTNKDLIQGMKVSSFNSFPHIVNLIFKVCIQIIFFPLGLVIFLATNGTEGPFITYPINNSNEKTLNPYQEELEKIIKHKLDQPLFTTTLRLVTNKRDGNRIRGFISSLSPFASSYQSFRMVKSLKIGLLLTFKEFLFKKRIHNIFYTSILSVSEVSDLYHFPFTTTTHTEDIQKIFSKELPVPLHIKHAKNLDVIFAKNSYGGNTSQIGLTEDERRRHMYVIGATGTGKSTMLLSMIKQDMEHGKGLCVIDPHGELIENILNLVPQNRIQDIIYFNPDDISFPVGLNLLELPPDISGDVLLREKELITESIISLFHKIYDEKYSGPRMEYILRNTIHTAFILPHPTLFTIYKLLINEDFRKQVTAKITDENLKDFWKYEFSKAGDYQKVKMISPITNKIGRFLFSPTAKRILEQEKSTINFEEIMDQGKILLCNVSKGKIGEDNSEVFGTLIMTKIQLAALRRARINSDARRDFYLYVDEFQNFATPAFAQILSEARKYKLNAILAHQTTSQLQDKSLVNITLANTGTIICFRTANPEDERLILPQFFPYVKPGEIDNLPSFHFYIKVSAIHPQEPFSGETIPLSIPHNSVLINEIITASRDHFTKEFKEIIESPVSPVILQKNHSKPSKQQIKKSWPE